MSERIYLKPAQGRVVPLPSGEPCPQEGAWLDDTAFVRRRLADGDLVKARPASEAGKAEKGPAK